MLVGEFAENSALWFWYDSWIAIVGLVLARLFTLQVLIKTRWSNPIALLFKLLAVAGTAVVALIVADRLEVETITPDVVDPELYGYGSMAGAVVAVVLGLYATLFVEGGGCQGPQAARSGDGCQRP